MADDHRGADPEPVHEPRDVAREVARAIAVLRAAGIAMAPLGQGEGTNGTRQVRQDGLEERQESVVPCSSTTGVPERSPCSTYRSLGPPGSSTDWIENDMARGSPKTSDRTLGGASFQDDVGRCCELFGLFRTAAAGT